MAHQLPEALRDRVLTVTEYLDLVNELIAPLKVSVEGEVTDLKLLREWVFFSLKDAESGALLRCGLHAQGYRRLGVSVEEGMQVKCLGYGKISPKTGNFGFWVSAIEPLGEGALRRAYELLLVKLRDEGLFTRKRELPQCISHIGVISSRDGVVLQDLRRNLPNYGIRVDFLHSGVEGAGSAPDIVRALELFSTTTDRPQVLVVIRGGGSLESLQGFNNEAVARALFAAPMPVLVGIGHDVDAPIATLVADWSASTPTAVAHVIKASWTPLTERVPQLTQDLMRTYMLRLHGLERKVLVAGQGIRGGMSRILTRFATTTSRLRDYARRGRTLTLQCERGVSEGHARRQERVARRITQTTERVDALARLLTARDPDRLLAQGFSLAYGPRGLVRSVTDVAVGETLRLRMKDGTMETTVTALTSNNT